MSCHDCVVKGRSDDCKTIQRLVPDVSDFPVYWIETRSGIADAKTGLLPNLLTVSAVQAL